MIYQLINVFGAYYMYIMYILYYHIYIVLNSAGCVSIYVIYTYMRSNM